MDDERMKLDDAGAMSTVPVPVHRRGTIAIVLHRNPGSTGAIGQCLVEAGYDLDIRRPKFGDTLPDDVQSYAGGIIFGGPDSANDRSDFIVAETKWIGKLIDAKTPYLGVCLGGQMLAGLLGAEVSLHPDGFVERGYYPLIATNDGQALCEGWPGEVYHWHKEGFDLPAHSTPLAVSDGPFPNQAFRFGESAIGLQFHPEITYMMINRWSRNQEPLSYPGAKGRDDHFTQHLAHSANVRRWLQQFLPAWLCGAQR